MRIGDKVRFTGCNEAQIKWGNNDNPEGKLVIGMEYIVATVEVHSWHTKISLEGIDGRFNSVCFEKKRNWLTGWLLRQGDSEWYQLPPIGGNSNGNAL